jgi:CheY-like chemotaxis protein
MRNKILLVDDDVDFVEATKSLLETKGYDVSFAHNGEDGYQKAKTIIPSLMLLDVMMTHESEGFDVARKLSEDPATQKIPVLLLTGIRKAMNLPFSFEPDADWLPVKAVLEKPIKPDELLKQVTEALGN